MRTGSSITPRRFSVGHSSMHMPTLAPMVPKYLSPIFGSGGTSHVCSQPPAQSIQPIPEVNTPQRLPPRGYSGMETVYNAPCDEYISDIELKRKKPVHPITGKPQPWFFIIKSKFLRDSDTPAAPILLGKQSCKAKHNTKSSDVVLRPSTQVTESWHLLPPSPLCHNRRTCILPAYHQPTGTLHMIKATRRGTCANRKHAAFLLNEWKVLEVLRREGRKRTPYLQGPSKEVDLWAWKDEKALYHVTVSNLFSECLHSFSPSQRTP